MILKKNNPETKMAARNQTGGMTAQSGRLLVGRKQSGDAKQKTVTSWKVDLYVHQFSIF